METRDEPTLCRECEFRRGPARLPAVRAGALASAAIIESVLAHQDNLQNNKAFEREKQMAGDSFVRPPRHAEWCQRYTLLDDQCAELLAAWKRGDDGPARRASEEGYGFDVDLVRGRVVRLYALCMVQNTGRCPGFRRRGDGGES